MNQVEITSLSSKGQVVIPNNIRKQMGISIGSKLLVLTDGDNLLLKPVQTPKLETFKKLIKEAGKVISGKKIKKSDIPKLIKRVRNENRS